MLRSSKKGSKYLNNIKLGNLKLKQNLLNKFLNNY